MTRSLAIVLSAGLIVLASATTSTAELLTNPEFDTAGDGWGNYGASGFNSFFGPNAHVSLFADGNGNFGGVFQLGITGTAGTEYTFKLTDVRIEENFEADFRFGLEYYAGDDATKLGETIVTIDTSTTGDGLMFSMDGTAVTGTAFVRPIFLFDNAVAAGSQDNEFVFSASLIPEPATAGLMLFGSVLILCRRPKNNVCNLS